MTPPPHCRRLFNQREIHRTGREHTEEEGLGRNRCCVYMEWNNRWRTAVVAPSTQKTVDKFKPRQVSNWFKKKFQGPTTGQGAENRRLQTALNGASISHLPFLIPFHTVHFRMDGKKIFKSQMWLVTRKQCFPDRAGNMHMWTHRQCDSRHKTCASPSRTKIQHGSRLVALKPTPRWGAAGNW